MSALAEELDLVGTGAENDEGHYGCACRPEMTLCGIFMPDSLVFDGDLGYEEMETTCVVCIDFEEGQPCPYCNDFCWYLGAS